MAHAAEGRGGGDQHGRQRSLDRQRVYRAPVAEREIRRGLSAGVREWTRGAALAVEVFRLLQRTTRARDPRLRHTRRSLFRRPSRHRVVSSLKIEHERQHAQCSAFRGYRGSDPPRDHRFWGSIRSWFFHPEAKNTEPELLPPFGHETARLGKTIDED